MIFPERYTERLILKMISPKVLDHVYEHFPDWQIMEFLGIQSQKLLNTYNLIQHITSVKEISVYLLNIR